MGLHHDPRPPKKPYNQANLLVESTSSGPREFTLGPESEVLEFLMCHHCTPTTIIVNLNLSKHSTQFEKPNFKLGSIMPWISSFLNPNPSVGPSSDTIFFGDVEVEGRQGKLPCYGDFQFNKHFG